MYKLILLSLIFCGAVLFAGEPIDINSELNCATSGNGEVEKITIGDLNEDTMTRDLTIEPQGDMFLSACYQYMQKTLVCEFEYGFLGRNYRLELDLEQIELPDGMYDDEYIYYLQGYIKKSFAKQRTVICRQ